MPTLRTTADGSKTLYSERYAQTYHSQRGALAEARHVFLGGAGLAARLAAGGSARVLEVGFGTGLNFLLSADLALETGGRLDYCALEKELLAPALLEALGYRAHLEHGALMGALLGGLERGLSRWDLAPGVTLELRIGEATLQALPAACCDVIYHDAFSPDANPELWDEAFLQRLYSCLEPGGLLVSYCVKGAVRRLLQGLGFEVLRRPGPPGGKREVLVARKPLP